MAPSPAHSVRVTRAVPQTAPFPSQQLFVLALCRICEPIAFMSIFPYVYYMVSSFKVTEDDRHIAVYAGMVTSAFAFAEFSTGVMWGRLSDRVGRKPILLTGLAGTGLSMLIFGFAPNLQTALLARALGGLLNGNIGVLQTTVAEVVTVEAHQPRAYSIMPFVWCLGSIIGSGLGGTLAEPAKSYPAIFLPGSFFDRFPYLLPNLVCAFVVLVSLTIGILFLEESHEDKKHRRDVGLELGKWVIRKLCRRTQENLVVEKVDYVEESLSFLADGEQPPEYRSTEGTPTLSCVRPDTPDPPSSPLDPIDDVPLQPKTSTAQAFTKQVILNIVGFGILAFHTISCEQLLPVLLSMPESDEPAHLPFKFTGGFALPTKSIGFILSVQGFLQMAVQIFVFPAITRKLGSLMTFRLVIMAYPFLYFLVPYLALLPHRLRMPGIYLVLVWKVTAQSLAYPSTAIMLNNSAPSKKVLGTLNGAAASSASLCRAFGPTVSGLIQAAGLRIGYSGLSWWSSSVVAMSGAILSLWLTEAKRIDLDSKPCGDDDANMEQPFSGHLIDPTALDAAIAATSVSYTDEVYVHDEANNSDMGAKAQLPAAK